MFDEKSINPVDIPIKEHGSQEVIETKKMKYKT